MNNDREADAPCYLCMPCAVTEKDFVERMAENSGPWDGSDSHRAWINGRAHNLIYSPAPVTCGRCGQETHWAYQPDRAHRPDKLPLCASHSGEPATGSSKWVEATLEEAVDLYQNAARLTLLLREAALDAVLVQSRTEDSPQRAIKAGPGSPHASPATIEAAVTALRLGIETLRQFIRHMEERAKDATCDIANLDAGVIRKLRAVVKRTSGVDEAA